MNVRTTHFAPDEPLSKNVILILDFLEFSSRNVQIPAEPVISHQLTMSFTAATKSKGKTLNVINRSFIYIQAVRPWLISVVRC